jgi:zinc finger protein
MAGEKQFTITVDDPAGNSYIENLCAPKPDPQILIKHYNRTPAQNEAIGLTENPVPIEEEFEKEKEQGITKDDLAFKEEIHTFPGNCSRCNIPCETKMHMLGIIFLLIFLKLFSYIFCSRNSAFQGRYNYGHEL